MTTSTTVSYTHLDVYKRQLEHNANVARAMHLLGAEATEAFEGGRAKVASFIGGRPEEIVFTKNASEALNLAAHALGQHLKLGPGDEVVTTVMEHHSNIVPSVSYTHLLDAWWA